MILDTVLIHAFEYVFKVNHEKLVLLIETHHEIRSILDKIDEHFAEDVAGIILKKKISCY